MKKTFLTFLVVLFMTGAYAQIGAGIKAGVNFANVDIEDVDTESKTGYHFGAFVEIKPTDNISVQPELLYSTQGMKSDDIDIDFSYLTIPVMVKFKFLQVLNLQVGPQAAFLFNAEDEDGEDLKESFKGADFSLAAGAGVDLPMGLQGGVRYVWGLSNLGDGELSDITVKNRTLQVYLGLSLF